MYVQIQPLQEQMDAWIKNFVPEKDLFFLEEPDLLSFRSDLQSTLVMPRDEFFNHSSYNGIQWVNSYMYWNISKDAQFVLVAQPDWITSLAMSKKEKLFNIQQKLGRGLIGPLSFLSEITAFPKEYIFNVNDEQFVSIQKSMWMKLPTAYQEEIMITYAQQYDEWTAMAHPAKMPVHLKKYANTFSMEPGANCLAATLYAISADPEKDEWKVHEWIHDGTFAEGLKNAGFSPTDEKFQKGDVVAWVNESEIIQHAAYCIEDQLFFNKNGQTFFNPWKIVHWDELKEEWKRYTPRIYRKSCGKRSDSFG